MIILKSPKVMMNREHFFPEEMKDLLVEAKAIMARMQESPPPKRQKWSDRGQACGDSWVEHHSQICETAENEICSFCREYDLWKVWQ